MFAIFARMTMPYPPRFSGKIQFDRSKLLGKGGFSIVYQGTYFIKPVAVKRISVEYLNNSLEREINLHPTLNHENILKILLVEQDDDFR